ncbi:Aspartyl-tRNA synthetase, archaeal-type [Trema orientale]|uniref:aspartate--tRNA ligase n=1 Tax=Trema orientale TaxID=63057 RepID=A0A2P5FRJ0_TREOI|nr:Aspartyl-tRNA synthetase, archaeal-type [Trema orientale]
MQTVAYIFIFHLVILLLPPLSETPSSVSDPPQPEQSQAEDESKSVRKKEAAKLEKLRRRQEAALASSAANYGDVPLPELQSKTPADVRLWTDVGALNEALKDQYVLVRGRAQTIRPVSKNMAFVLVREKGFTLQCVVTAIPDVVSRQMVKFVSGVNRESIVDVEGIVSVPKYPITGATQQVEIQVRKFYCVNRALPNLPINIEDAARSDIEYEKAKQAGEQAVQVRRDTRLDNRVIDTRTPANQGIFRIQCQVGTVFRQFLLSEGFVEIHTPKLIASSSEGGASVFELDYKGQPACLAQSPQLHKQMAICGDFGRVFEIGPVFRAENSHSQAFVLNKNCEKELKAVSRQYPFEPLKFLRKTLRLTFEEGVQMLKDAGVEVDPLGDLNTESERKLGKLVLEK